MSRSRRHTPIIGLTTAESEKSFKALEHRRERRSTSMVLSGFIVWDPSEHNPDIPPPKEFGNPWAGPKDGRQYLREPTPKLMRK